VFHRKKRARQKRRSTTTTTPVRNKTKRKSDKREKGEGLKEELTIR
jgi:hypothetical protein